MRLPVIVLMGFLYSTPSFSQTTYYVNDNSTVGDVFTTAAGNNANPGTAAAPFASLQHAVTVAAANDMIYVDAGSYAEQVIINKGVTIIGAGQSLSLFTPPASALVPAPGPFTEIGLFETTQGIGDVHLSNLSINSNNASQNIIIQSGGSVKNCTLLNGYQGIFFRVEPTIKTALIENNTIQPIGIGINCQGSGLTAIIRNNNISRAAGYFAGIFAGLDFGAIPQLTIQNNIIHDYTGIGLEVNSNNGNYNSNSFLGTNGALAIRRLSGNIPNASCNWFGSIDANVVVSKISGTINFAPFLSSGTDNNVAVGFQPVNDACSGTFFYVNDNSMAGDVFTSAPGSNSNNGSSSAPFATISYALTQAAADDYIYVDAGTYTEQVTTDKGISIIGAGQTLTSILKPAATIPPPGPGTFAEVAVIQSSKDIIGDVHISNLSVTGDFTMNVTPIIIHGGGSVRNCKLQNGNQGIFVRIDPSIVLNPKTFVVDGNTIHAEYIAVNFAGGNRLTAFLTNNNISAFNPGFSSGTWAGTDFGTLNGLTITGNLFSSYVGDGLFINSNNCTISQNSFLGTGSKAINKSGGGTINATCNWYGSADVNIVASKVTAGVTFSPWLANGTDDNAAIGFQPVANACTGKQTRFYVNNNTSCTRIFTTAAGNDANPGIPSAPFASISAAYQKAQTGDSLFVDAGTYAPGDGTIGKSISIIGTNYLLSPNDVANPLLINSTRNAETIIENLTWTIGANEINLEGLTFNPNNKQALIMNNTNFGNIKLSKNRFRINSSLIQVSITGNGSTATSPAAIVNSGLTVSDNRFEKLDAGGGTSLAINRFRNIGITNNSFVVAGATFRTQIATSFGSSGVVDGLYCANNTFDFASSAFSGARIGSAFIIGNMIHNTNNAFVVTNSIPESSDIFFLNNILNGSAGILPFIQYNRTAGAAAAAVSNFTVENNIITGNAVAGTTSLLGSMNILFQNTVLNPRVIIGGNIINYGGDLSTVPAHFIRPIMLRGNLVNAVVEKNEINLTGINQQSKTAGVDLPVSPAITLHPDNGATSFLQSGSVINIRNNKINGFKHSFAVYDAANGRDTYIGYGNIYAGVTVNVNNNSFTGDSISINNGSIAAATVINATCNWYGSSIEADVKQKISIADVQHIPWLTNGTDNDVATGFQPVANTCNGYQRALYVNDNNPTGDVFTTAIGSNSNPGTAAAPFATLNYAISKAKNGDTIYVDAGTYIENVIVNKSVTILGAKHGQKPDSSLNRGGESIFMPALQVLGLAGTIIQPAANNITIDGLLLDGDNPALTGGSAINGVDVNIGCGIFNNNVVVESIIAKNNIVKNVQIYGIGLFRTFGNQTGPAVSGNLFTQNRIDNASRGVVFAYNAYGDITNNYISRCSGSGTWFSQQRVANVNNAPSYVTGNTIVNCNLGMQSSSLFTPASMVYYLNNELTNNTTTNFAGVSLLVGHSSGIVAANNKISGYAIGFYINATNAVAPILINNNSLTNFTNFAIAVESSNPVDAACNWYGSAAVQDFYTKLSLAADMEILPWLTNGTDNDAATGFQPVPGACDGYPTLIILNGSTNVTCNDAANGTINITASYGKAPFTYSWTKEGDANFVSHDEDPSGLAPGTYTLSITDGNAANIYLIDPEAETPGTITVTITEPDTLTASASGSNNVCFNGTIGTSSVLASGGTAPYTYLWSNGDATNEISNLAAGIYDVTVTDANGCTATASYEVTQPTQVTASIANNSTACSNIATVTAGGGTPGYTYLWSNGSASPTISGVPVGTYSNTVTDANGCTVTTSVTLTVAEAFNPSASVTKVTCFGANNGIITVTNANGTAPFMFSKDGGVTFAAGSFPYSFTNLAPGTYNIAVKDANGCTGFVERTVIQPTALTVTINTVQSTCFGASTGAINVSVSGGVTAYSYNWTKVGGGFSSSQLNISGLAAGNYTLTVTDKNGCTAVLPVTVPSNNEIIVHAATTNVICRNTATGAINLTVTGGTGAGFTYSWTGTVSSSNEDLNNIVAANNYNVRITDIGSGCFVNRSYRVTQPATLTLSIASSNNATTCTSLGAITVTAGGGSGGYQYSINGGAYQSSNSFTGLYAGTYTIAVRDANGCTTTVARNISDSGSDLYESNNGRTQSKPINIGTIINARLANANDVADWFVITTPAGGSASIYSLAISHPVAGISYTFNIFPASPNNAAALIPINTVGTTAKHYLLAPGTSFRIGVTTATLSFVCYSLSVNQVIPVTSRNNSVSPVVRELPQNPAIDILKSVVYPNPHRGSFTLRIESPEEGVGTVEMYNVNGQLLGERKVNLVKGKGNLVQYNNMNHALLFYRVHVGKHVVNGKIMGAN